MLFFVLLFSITIYAEIDTICMLVGQTKAKFEPEIREISLAYLSSNPCNIKLLEVRIFSIEIIM